jgi:hypothetical protein
MVFLWHETKKFPKLPDYGPFIVVTTYDILLRADKDDIMDVFQLNMWREIITDEAHTYRNWRTCRALSLLRLVRGKKATPELRKSISKSKKRAFESELRDDPKEVRKSFSEQLIDCRDQGSPKAFW